jgi:hypothetical protein
MWQGPIDSGQEDTVESVALRSAAVAVFITLVLVPARAEATIDSVTVKATRDYIVALTVTDSAGESDTNVIRMGFVDMTPA